MTASKYQYTIFIAMMLLGLLLSVLSTLIVYKQLMLNYHSEMHKAAQEEFRIRKNSFNKTIFNEPADILSALKQSATMAPLFFEKEKHVTDEQKDLFKTIALAIPTIMQLRYIDTEGFERLRINRNAFGSEPYIVPEHSLQNKSHRYYFEAIKQSSDALWVSHTELNLEHKAVMMPATPTIRVGTPLYKQNRFTGVLIINLYIEPLLAEIKKSKLFTITLYEKHQMLHQNTHYHVLEQLPDNYMLQHTHTNADDETYVFKLFQNSAENENYYIVFEPKSKNIWQLKALYGPLILLNIILLPVIFTFAYFVSIIYRRLYVKHQIQDNYLIQKSKMAAIGEMLGFISHEWRQPLGSMASEIMRAKTDIKTGKTDDKQFIEVLNNQEKELKHLSETLGFFKSFYEPSDNNDYFSAVESIKKATKFISYRMIKYNITMNQQFQLEPSKTCYGSEFAFMTVMTNILTNAIDALVERQAKSPSITITVNRSSDSFLIAITDNAGGASKDIDLQTLFKPYYTTKKESGGTGLGLYIAKLIMHEKFGGNISVQKESNGLCFIVTCPISSEKSTVDASEH